MATDIDIERDNEMKIIKLPLILILITFIHCGNGLVSTSNSPLSFVTTDPGLKLVSFNPTDGEDHVSVSSAITATFSKDIDLASVSSYSYILADSLYNPISGAYSFPDPRTVVFTPTLPLDYLTEYNVLITPDLKDTGGSRFASDKIWYFTTQSSGTTPDPTFDPTPGPYEGPRPSQ